MKTNLDLALECGADLMPGSDAKRTLAVFYAAQLDAFAERVRAEERERCALVADKEVNHCTDCSTHHYAMGNDEMAQRWTLRAMGCRWVASEIRRGAQ